jgi:hypothetical protein
MDNAHTTLSRMSFKKTFTAEYDNDQTAQVVLTPPTGKRIRVSGYMIATDSTTGGVRLFFAAPDEDTVGRLFGASGNSGYVPCLITGDRNEPLKITSTLGATKRCFVSVNYTEV